MEQAAQVCADDYHAGGGWETSWPIIFHVIRDGEDLGLFEVERHTVPEFVAQRVRE